MDPVVTARVPAGIRQRGIEVLRDIGSTTSELVNAAFDYVIQERRLPRPKAHASAEAGARMLDEAQSRELARFFENVKVPLPQDQAAIPFDRLLDDAMKERYANLR